MVNVYISMVNVDLSIKYCTRPLIIYYHASPFGLVINIVAPCVAHRYIIKLASTLAVKFDWRVGAWLLPLDENICNCQTFIQIYQKAYSMLLKWVNAINPEIIDSYRSFFICTLRNWVNAKVNFVLHISSYDNGLVRQMWYYNQYVITIAYIMLSLCWFGLFNRVPSVPRVTMILYWKWRIVMRDTALRLTRSKQMSLTCRMY